MVTLFGMIGLGELTQSLGALAQTQQASTQQTSSQRTSAQPASARRALTRKAPTRQRFGGFFAPQGRAMPKDSEGGASRGRCLQNRAGSQNAVTLLTPEGNSGLTVSSHPSFMAHVGEASAKQVFFSLKNEDESYFFEMTMKLSADELGLVTFQLPQSAPALEPGEPYRWSVAAICGSKIGPDSPWASGWIERVDDIELETVRGLPAIQQASHYGEAGLWYDTVDSLARYRKANRSAEAQAAWSQLLADGNLQMLLQPTQDSSRR